MFLLASSHSVNAKGFMNAAHRAFSSDSLFASKLHNLAARWARVDEASKTFFHGAAATLRRAKRFHRHTYELVLSITDPILYRCSYNITARLISQVEGGGRISCLIKNPSYKSRS